MITVKEAGRFLGKNSHIIMTGVAITGVFTTSFLVADATPKALRKIEERECKTRLEKIEVTWKYYIPAGISGLITVGSIIALNSVHERRNAALAGLYSLAQTTLNEYKEKVVETIGENKERKIRDAVDADRVLNNPPGDVIITDSGSVLCFDSLTGRYFLSDIEKIRQIVNELNRELLREMFIPLNELYFELGLDPTELGNDLGFNVDQGLLDIRFSSQLTKDGKPCLVLNYEVHPRY